MAGVVHLEMSTLLRFAIAQQVSDIHLKPGRPPMFRRSVQLELAPSKGHPVVTEQEILAFLRQALSEKDFEILEKTGSVDAGYGEHGVGRFRITAFRGLYGIQAVLRVIPARIPTLQELNLPSAIEKVVENRRGLVLITGATGQGKSTTLASLLDLINRQWACHIVTVEDPIEHVIEDRRAIVTQRQVGKDTRSFYDGLREAFRQDPDIIVVGEMRDKETIETALVAAETGHLVFSTMHTLDAKETLNRIMSAFPAEEREYAKGMLASTIVAVISQRLVQGKQGRLPAVEIMLGTARVKDLIKRGAPPEEIVETIAQGYSQYGTQTFDQSLMFLFKSGKITLEEAMKHCSNPSDFLLRVKGISSESATPLDVLGKKDERF
jgi:twitching motility protein PilT